MTLDMYAGLFEDDLDAVAVQLDAASCGLSADFLRTKSTVVDMTAEHTGR